MSLRAFPLRSCTAVVWACLAVVVLPVGLLAASELCGSVNHLVYVSNERSGDISVIDPTTRAVVRTIPAGKRPRGIHFSPDGQRLFVALSGSPRLGPGADPERARLLKADKAADGIAVIDPAVGRVLRKLFVGSDPEEFAVSGDGRLLFVSNEDEAAASCWEIESGRRVFQASVSDEPEGVALHPTRAEVYVTCEEKGEVFVLNASDGSVLARLETGGRPRTVAFLPDGSRAYVPVEGKAEVAVVDATTRRIIRRIAIPGRGAMPMGALAAPNGREVYVSTGRGNTVAVLETANDAVATTIPVGERVWGIALSPDATTLYTANGASNDVSVIDVRARKETARIKVGEGPWGIAIGPEQTVNSPR